MATETEPKKDVYEIITSRIIEQLEQGKVPWKQTWTEEVYHRTFSAKTTTVASTCGFSCHLGTQTTFSSPTNK
jgi:antirestriction protein ArdC